MNGLAGMDKAGRLRESVAFDAPNGTADAFGGTSESFSNGNPVSAQMIYQKGDEAVQSARLAGRQVFKIKVRSSSTTRAVTTDHRMRDVRRGDVYNILEVDKITDRAWVWMQVEGPQSA